jgi:hypothetical protein
VLLLFHPRENTAQMNKETVPVQVKKTSEVTEAENLNRDGLQYN